MSPCRPLRQGEALDALAARARAAALFRPSGALSGEGSEGPEYGAVT